MSLSHQRAAETHTSLRIHTVSPYGALLTNTKNIMLMVHVQHLAVNFLQYFITQLFSLTCFFNHFRKETAQKWAQNPLSERFLYFVNYLRPSNNSRASFTVFSDSSGYSYELLRDLL